MTLETRLEELKSGAAAAADPKPKDAWDAIWKLDVLDRRLEALAREAVALRILEGRLRAERRDAEGLALLYLADARPGTAIRASHVEYLLVDDGLARWLAPLVTLDALALELPGAGAAAKGDDRIEVEVPVTIGEATPEPPAPSSFLPLLTGAADDVIDPDWNPSEPSAAFELPADGPAKAGVAEIDGHFAESWALPPGEEDPALIDAETA